MQLVIQLVLRHNHLLCSELHNKILHYGSSDLASVTVCTVRTMLIYAAYIYYRFVMIFKKTELIYV